MITAKAGNKIIKESFFTCLKPNGTFNIKTANRISQARRQRLANFIEYYFKIKDTSDYNLKENIKKWKGKKVDIQKDLIFIP